jgi:hypothetical protein
MVALDQPGEGKGEGKGKGEGEGTVTVTFAGCGDAFGSGGRLQACIHIRRGDRPPVLLDCGAMPHHLSHADLAEHERDLTARRVVLTHMSADMLARVGQARHQPAHDGLTMSL